MKTSRRSSNKLVIYQGVALSTIYLLLLLPFNGTVRTSELLNKYYYLNGPDLISNHSSSAVPLTTGYTPRVVGAYPSVAFHLCLRFPYLSGRWSRGRAPLVYTIGNISIEISGIAQLGYVRREGIQFYVQRKGMYYLFITAMEYLFI